MKPHPRVPKTKFALWPGKLLLVILVLLCFSCSAKLGLGKKTFDFEAHRGGRGLMPENTIAAMLRALRLGVTTLEMDAVITKDKQVILSHEPFFNHEITTKPDGTFVTESEEKSLNIYQMTYAQASTYDVGLKPHPKFPRQLKMKAAKPKLAQVIDSVEAYCRANNIKPPLYNIETKSKPATDNIYHPEPEEFVDLLMNVIHFKLMEGRVIIQSFDPRTLQYLHKKYPSIKTSLLIEGFDTRTITQQIAEMGFTPNIYSPEYRKVTPELIRQCHSMQMQVIPWTINDASEIKRLKEMGVDGLITDYPDIKY